MNYRIVKHLNPTAGFALLLARSVLGQGDAARPEFEVADVKLNKSGDAGNRGGILPGGQFSVRNVSLHDLIRFAHNTRDEYIIGGPGWLTSDHFDIIGKAPAGTPDSTLRLMLQTLLAEKFNLATHRELKPMDVFVLVVGKNGHKLQKAASSGPADCKRSVTPQMEAEANCLNVTIADLAASLETLAPAYVDRQVVDMTGLTGSYDLTLKWVGRAMVDQGGLTMFDAVDKMLGLKLEGQKRPVPVVVIDRVEKLADN